MTDKEVILYSSPGCGPCKAAKSYFKDHGIRFTEYDVTLEPQRAIEIMEKTGSQSVPVIIVGEKVFTGFEKAEIAKELGIN